MKLRTISRVSVIALIVIVGAAIVLHARLAATTPNHPFSQLVAGVSFSQPAPIFQLADQDGATIALARLHGHVVVLTFVDTSSASDCAATAQVVNAIASNLGDLTRDVVWLAVSVHPNDTPASVRQTLAADHVTVPLHVLLGTPGELAPVWKAYGVEVTASSNAASHTMATYVIDSNGIERELLRQPVDPRAAAQDLRSLLAAPH